MIILDASVIIKWFLQEEGSIAALKFKDAVIEERESIVVPDLILYEVTNVLRFKKAVKEEIITEVIPFLFDIGLEIIAPSKRLIQDALHLSFVTELSIYDSVYLALANEINAAFITADKRILQQAEPFAVVKPLI